MARRSITSIQFKSCVVFNEDPWPRALLLHEYDDENGDDTESDPTNTDFTYDTVFQVLRTPILINEIKS